MVQAIIKIYTLASFFLVNYGQASAIDTYWLVGWLVVG